MKKLGFGFMRLPLINDDDPSSIDMQKSKQMVDYFMNKGFTYFDTAYPYQRGKSEEALRELLVKRYPRKSFILANKLPSFLLKSAEDCQRIFDEQLVKCGVDYFDYYLVHDLGASSYKKCEKFGGFDLVNKKKAEGKIKHLGFSFHDTADVLEKILDEHPETEFVQLQLNYVDWDSDTVQAKRCYELARSRGKEVIVMEPVKGGMLANLPKEAELLLKDYHPEMSVSSWAVRFAASHEGVITVLSGMSNMEQLMDNISYMDDFKPLNQEELKLLSKVEDIIKSQKTIACTACKYCIDGCPKNIAIPKFFMLYNGIKIYGNLSHQRHYYANFIEDHAKASDCIECRKCEKVCPQHLNITKYLKQVAEKFEV